MRALILAAASVVALAGPAFAENQEDLIAQMISEKFPKCIRPIAQHTKDDCAAIRADLNTLYTVSIHHGRPPAESAKWAASRVECDRRTIEGWRGAGEGHRGRWISDYKDVLQLARGLEDLQEGCDAIKKRP